MGQRGSVLRATVSVDDISELPVGRHRSHQKSPTPGGKRSTSISRKRQRSQSPRPAAAAIAGIRVGRLGISPVPRGRSTSRKRLPKQKTAFVKIVPVKNHPKAKKKLPPKKVESSSSSDEYSSESDEDEGLSSGAAKPASKVANKESSGDDDSSEESSSSDEENDRGAITPGSRRDNNSFKKPGQSSSYAAFIRFDSSLGEDEIRSSLQQHLSSCGEITSVSIAKDYDTCASKGIPDMEFSDKSSLPKALELTGSDLRGFSLLVDEPKPSPDNRDGNDSDRGRDQSGGLPRQSAGSPSAAPNFMDYGLILVLFETPSGFAIFNLFERDFREDGLENIWANFGEPFRCEETLWLDEFRTFKDKSTAITHGTGVNRELTNMILRHHRPNQKLAVGKPEYKTIIEKSLVNEKIVVLACVLFDCDYLDKRNYTLLSVAVDCLKDTSGINAEGWDLMKLVTALMIMRNLKKQI